MKRPGLTALAVISLLCLAAVAAFAQGLRLQMGSYDPATQAPPIPPEWRAGPPMPGLGYRIVQFAGPVRPEWKTQLQQQGIKLVDYLPDNAFVVKTDAAALGRARRLPFVRWAGELDPGLRMSPSLVNRSGPIQLSVVLFPGEGADGAIRAIRMLGGSVTDVGLVERAVIEASAAAEAAPYLASLPEVAWVEEAVPVVPKLNVVQWILNVGNQSQIPTAWAGRYAPLDVWALGLRGQNQVIAISDTGLDTGQSSTIHPDFAGRVPIGFGFGRPGDWSDKSGHGTMVAGCAAGNGKVSGSDPLAHQYAGFRAGMAPEASLIPQSIETAQGDLSAPADLADMWQPVYDLGARIQNHSWGTAVPTAYDLDAWQADSFVSQHPDFLMTWAAGNEGVDANGDGVIDPGSLSGEAENKNSITVGATESYLPAFTQTWGQLGGWTADPIASDLSADNIFGMAAFSSRGPAHDNRTKPDLVAPGWFAMAPKAGGGYAVMSGTSMAAPLVAGCAALVRQYFQQYWGISSPSASLIKAALINNADDLKPGQYTTPRDEVDARPSLVDGFGRVNVGNIIYTLSAGRADMRRHPVSGRVMFVSEGATGLQTGDRRQQLLIPSSSSKPFRATLVWTDPPAAMGAAKQLVNNLDLRLDEYASTGKFVRTLFGSGMWSGAAGASSPDDVNNVEELDILQPVAGNRYVVSVVGTNVPKGPQKYSLVVTGPLLAPAGNLSITGKVVSVTGSPVAGVTVNLSGAATARSTTQTDGTFVFSRLSAGSYRVTPGYLSGVSYSPSFLAVELASASVNLQPFVQRTSYSILGFVRKADGTPVASVQVTAARGGSAPMIAYTNSNGYFRFWGIPLGTYLVRPAKTGMTFVPTSATVTLDTTFWYRVANFTAQ